jgi:hypothetical protein
MVIDPAPRPALTITSYYQSSRKWQKKGYFGAFLTKTARREFFAQLFYFEWID